MPSRWYVRVIVHRPARRPVGDFQSLVAPTLYCARTAAIASFISAQSCAEIPTDSDPKGSLSSWAERGGAADRVAATASAAAANPLAVRRIIRSLSRCHTGRAALVGLC